MKTITSGQLAQWLKPRPTDSHKGTFGRLLVTAGSQGMAGAAILAGLGAYRTGVGLVVFAVPKELFPVMAIGVPEGICHPRDSAVSGESAFEAICAGPGLGAGVEEADLIRAYLRNWKGPLVLDADALNCIALYGLHQEVRESSAELILTPHPGEAARLLSLSGRIEDREQTVLKLADIFGATVVLKGAGTLIARMMPGEAPEVYRNPTGNPGMATAGSGDVLAGAIGALCASGLDGFSAALSGVYLHGLAGDLAAARFGQAGVKARDIAEMLPQAVYTITGK